MYLKNIEVQGFKSFANKINFEFHNGITAIVGPNGSGKSNVADAVRWVLGEQRIKQLRGAKMEDVIFAGTETRKALGFAYVAITLDNSDHELNIDYEEVTVSRRLFRSGESEYMINGSICRLKDITELFYDTGIGKEGYSIIGQGQIEKILSGRPEERRELFDEAAGIVKFKRRKDITLKKLEDERLNLVRINDIISELEKQVNPLLKQSEKAKKYMSFKDELKKYDINLFLLEITNVKKQLSDIEQKYNIATNDFEENTKALEKIKSSYNSLENEISIINDLLEEKKQALNLIIIEKEKAESEKSLLNEKHRFNKLQLENFDRKIEELNQNILSNENEKDTLVKEKEELTIHLNELLENEKNNKDNHLKLNNKISKYEEEIEHNKGIIIDIINEKSNIKSKLQRYDTMLEQINKRKNELSEKFEKYKNDTDTQENIIKELSKELVDVESLILSNTKDAKDCEGLVKELLEEGKILLKENEQKQREFHQENSRLESLKNMTERYEGYGNSIKKIMEYKETKPGIIGVVADIIKVEIKYETAIETALGGSIQNIVTDNENTAKETIEYLKKNKLGRATFLPLSSIANKTGFNNEKVFLEKGVLGLACDLVKTDKDYENISKYLLGRIIVIDNIDNGLLLARKYSYTLRIVTLEGDLINPGGSMSGGAFKNSSNLLGRRREIEEIENKLAQIVETNKNIKEKISKNNTIINESNANLDNLKLKLNQLHLTHNTVSLNLKQAGNKKEEISEIVTGFDKEYKEMDYQLSDISKIREELIDSIKELDDKNLLTEEKIKELNNCLQKEKEEESKYQRENEEKRLDISKFLQQISFINEKIEKLISNNILIKKNIDETQKEKDILTNEELEIEKKVIDVISKINEFDAQANKYEIEISDITKTKDSQSKEYKEFFDKRDEVSDNISRLDKEIFRLNSQKERLEENSDSLINYMWNEYELTYNAAISLKNDELDNLPIIKKTIQEIKSNIKELGDVNVNAIDEYKEVVERYDFLTSQRNDLITAEKTLLGIIDELDEGMKKQFSEKFAQIRIEFDKVFNILFGGGKGTIQLQEDDDILEAGITIIAQPPGKKLQNMMQLSGGEKALTAISLLFAIQSLKPSPFCLLDEIEAALDDSNVSRFADYLHNLTKSTQFIVITHRRGTMSAADRLYGITMQEKGISTLVSVNLLEDELTS